MKRGVPQSYKIRVSYVRATEMQRPELDGPRISPRTSLMQSLGPSQCPTPGDSDPLVPMPYPHEFHEAHFRPRDYGKRAVPLPQSHKAMKNMERWWARQDSNLGPRDYESHEQKPHEISKLKNPKNSPGRSIDRNSETEPRCRTRFQ